MLLPMVGVLADLTGLCVGRLPSSLPEPSPSCRRILVNRAAWRRLAGTEPQRICLGWVS